VLTADPLLAQLMADPEPGPAADYLQERGATLADVLLLFRGDPPDYQGGLPRAALAEWVRRECPHRWVTRPPDLPRGAAWPLWLADAVLAVPEVTLPEWFAARAGPGPLRFRGYFGEPGREVPWRCCKAALELTYHRHGAGPARTGVVSARCAACGLGHFARPADCRAPDFRDCKRRVLALFAGVVVPLRVRLTEAQWNHDDRAVTLARLNLGLGLTDLPRSADATRAVILAADRPAPDLIPSEDCLRPWLHCFGSPAV
jgi:hypothetical protein